ncbi:MAG: peptidylprolyl isomerase, partial [Methylococcaceae bacterium]|nr:peptidylprolyl isomerase [Methylococcaceae bacterium]
IVTITKIDADNITIDGNHPLAGEPLTFAVEVVAIRAATEEELDHGHVHGAGGHHH